MEINFEVSLLHELLKISNADKIFIDSNGKMMAINNKLWSKDIRVEKLFNPEVIEEGHTIITKEIVNLMPKTGEVILTDNIIKCGKRKIEFTPAECAFKEIDYINKTLIQLDKETMNFLLEVDYAASKEEIRPILHGAHFKNGEVCALDGFRLSLRKSDKLQIDSEFTIPLEVIKIFKKIKSKEEVIISCNENCNIIKIQCGNDIIISKLLEGKFVNYNQLISIESTTEIRLDKNEIKELYSILKSYGQNEKAIKLTIKENEIYISAKSPDNLLTINDTIICNTKGKDLEIGVNYKYLKEALDKKEKVKLCFQREISPIIIKEITNLGEKIELALPIRLKKEED